MSALELSRAELGRYSKLYAMAAENKLPQRRPTDAWRLDHFGDETAIRLRAWKPGERVLDVGCGFSTMPARLQQTFGVEVWGADDFTGAGDHWRRGQDVEEFLRAGKVRYVTELIGNPERSSLPRGGFDCVYSKLGVHFSPPPHANIWRHMELLLSAKPGSELVVIAGCGAPAEANPRQGMQRLTGINRLEEIVLGAWRERKPAPRGFWDALNAEGNLLRMSPFLYCGYVMDTLGVRGELPAELRALNFCFDPDILVDPWHVAARRACFSRDPTALRNFNFGRTFALVLGFRRR